MFGILLLNDETGSRVDTIEDAYRGKPEKITQKILQQWLEGSGLPPTWKTLIKTIRDTGLSTLADTLNSKAHTDQPYPTPLMKEELPKKKRKISEQEGTMQDKEREWLTMEESPMKKKKINE